MKEFLEKLAEQLGKEAESAGIKLTEAIDYHSLVGVITEKVNSLALKYAHDIEEVRENIRMAQNELARTKSDNATELKKLSDEKEGHDAVIAQKHTHINDLAANETKLENNIRALLVEHRGIEESILGLRVQENQLKRTVDALVIRESQLKESLQTKVEEEAKLIESISLKKDEHTKLAYEVKVLVDRKKEN